MAQFAQNGHWLHQEFAEGGLQFSGDEDEQKVVLLEDGVAGGNLGFFVAQHRNDQGTSGQVEIGEFGAVEGRMLFDDDFDDFQAAFFQGAKQNDGRLGHLLGDEVKHHGG